MKKIKENIPYSRLRIKDIGETKERI